VERVSAGVIPTLEKNEKQSFKATPNSDMHSGKRVVAEVTSTGAHYERLRVRDEEKACSRGCILEGIMRSLAFAALGLLQTWEPLRPSGYQKRERPVTMMRQMSPHSRRQKADSAALHWRRGRVGDYHPRKLIH